MRNKTNRSGGIGRSWTSPLAAAAAMAIATHIASPTVLAVDMTITNVVGRAAQPVSWSNQELKVPKFDHTRGTLTQVRLDVIGNVRTTPKIENLTLLPRTMVFGSQATVVLLDPSQAPLATTQPLVLITRILGAFDGVANFAADTPGLPSGISQFSQTGTDQKTVVIDSSNASLLNQFVDGGSVSTPGPNPAGTLSLYASATGRWQVNGGAAENTDFAQDIKTDAGINVFVIYTYTPVGYTLSGRIWNDIDMNGIADPGEPGIPGQLVTLLYGSDLFSEPRPVLKANGDPLPGTLPQTTDANGRYQFSGFAPSDVPERSWYSIQISTAEGFTVNTYSLFGLSPDGSIVRSTIDLTADVDPTLAKTDINFGIAKSLARVSGNVWADANIDGTQNGQETGLSGIAVTLTNSTGTLSASTTTDSRGHYVFFGLVGDDEPATRFTVTVTPPMFYLPTFDRDDNLHATPGVGFTSPNQTSFPLPTGAVNENVNFGYFTGGQLGDRVWNDLNSNGVQDANEPGIGGVVLTLTGGPTDLTTTTDGNGYYTFGATNILGEGSYTVTAIPPVGYRQTYDLDDSSQPSNFATPNSTSVSLTAGQIRTDVDFGYARPLLSTASIGDRVWSDTNANGLQESGEVGIAGATVVLSLDSDAAATPIDTRVTDANGFYSFTDLSASTYRVTVSNLLNFRATAPSSLTTTVILADTQHRDDVDFGFQPLGSIGDLVWIDTNGDGAQNDLPLTGLPGATVTLAAQGFGVLVTNVAANGSYHFANLPPGTYTLSVGGIPADYTPTAGPAGPVTLAAGENNSSVDFGFRLPSQAVKNATVAGTVWLDTNGDGVQQGGVAGENGLAGVTLQLRRNSALIGTSTTGSDGGYSFTGLESGGYTLSLFGLAGNLIATYDFDDGTGPSFNTINSTGFILANGQNLLKVNFGYKRQGSIAGRVWNDADINGLAGVAENGLVGWPVKLTDQGGAIILQMATDASGNYSFNDLGPGIYRVLVTPLAQFAQTYDIDGLASANSAQVTLSGGQGLGNVNFGYNYCPQVGSIGDRVWNDVDGDGIQSVTETGLVGVAIILKQGNNTVATTQTGPNGIYGFKNLTAGTYTVAVTPPTGYVEAFGLDGITTGVNLATVVLSSGQNRTDADFGYRLPPPTCVVPTGSITCEHWGNTWGHSCSQVPVNSTPSSVCSLNSFEPAQNCGEHYGRRIRGYIVPPTTGNYVFWVSASDNSQLYLSTDHNSSNKRKVCETFSGCGFRDWNRSGSQRSVTCSLTAGVPYYVEVLGKQESGADHCSVSWSKPGENTSRPSEVIPSKCLAPITASLCAPGCAGTGLAGSYYRNTSLTSPVGFSRVDPLIDFSWGNNSPASNFGNENYSVSWNGQVEAPVTGSFTFTTTSDDGVRLWINGQQLVNNWSDHSATDNSGTITLAAGQKYSVKMEYYERSRGAVARLRWAYPGQAVQVVPTCRLYPTASQPTPPCVVKCEAENGNHSSNGAYHNNGCGYSSRRASGGSAVGWLDNVGAYCQVACTAPSSGTYQLKLRCSNGNSTPCVRSVYVNGAKCGTLTHNSTSDWETYTDSTPISVTLNSGNNTIKVCRDYSSQAGSIDIDYFECTK